MKKFIFLFSLLTIVFIMGCQNHLLPSPKVENTNTTETEKADIVVWAAPENLVASHGLKNKIELSWKGVKSASRYYIYEAPTPYDKFVQIAETTSNTTNYVIDEKSGALKYYKITAVKKDGEESPFSIVALGTTLATPVITYIGQDEENSDSTSSVHWYMNNCNTNTYQQNVRYTINCFDPQGNNVAEKIHYGQTDYPSIIFEDLNPNTNYTYQVTAYIVAHQSDTEISDKVDSATARRLRPNPPENLFATLGTSISEVKLSFDLPIMVDVALGNGIYEPKPLYFKIYRRVASENSTEADWVIIEKKFATQNFGTQSYEPGMTVTYTDTNELKRGLMYEYKVQSYADETTREISSNQSFATIQGFLMAVPKLELTNVKYTDNEETGTARQYIKIEANHILTWNNFGTEDNYNFIIIQEKSKLEGDGGDGSIVETKQEIFTSIQNVNSKVLAFDLSNNPQDVRGYYKYTIYIVPKGSTEISQAITSTKTIGQLLVTNDVDTPKVKYFSVSNGYKDKIVIEWDYNSTYKYNIVYFEEGSTEEIPIQKEEIDTLLQNKVNGDIVTFVHNTDSGTKRSYKIYPTSSQTETNLPAIEGSTLSTPVLYNKDLYHEKIAITLDEINADNLEFSAEYVNSSIANSNKIEGITVDIQEKLNNSENPYAYIFKNPTGFDNINVSGLPITVTVKANKNVTKNILTLVNEEAESIDEMYNTSSEKITQNGSNVIDSTSSSISTLTVGPAKINYASDKSRYSDKIQLTWDKVQGAKAYFIVRSQYTYTPDYIETYSNTQKYLVTESDGGFSVTSPGIVDDTGVVGQNVTVSLKDNKFTLLDKDINSPDETNAWQVSQSQIAWGTPYDYIVIPLVSESDIPEYDADGASPKSFTLPTVTYNNLSHTRGSAIGYAWNVSASKGWQTSTLSTENTAENTKIYISWKNPCVSSSIVPSYDIYRREEGSNNWTRIKEKVATTFYEDTPSEKGKIYEYQIGLSTSTGTTNPSNDNQYILHTDKNKDSKYTNEKLASGFVLPQPQIKSASREALANNAERITWYTVNVGNQNNRMIDGYAIEVYNNNIDSAWHEIAKFEVGTDLDKALYEYAKEVTNKDGYLKVLRDYKHYFRIRAFTKQDDKYSYSAAPSYTWSDGGENEYVKWGCRQITAQEFCKMANLAITYGLNLVNGTGWQTAYKDKIATNFTRTKSPSSPGSGTVYAESNFLVTNWDIVYNDFTQAFTTKTNKTVKYLIVNGTLNPKTTKVNNYPNSYDSGTITITSDAPGTLYDGSITYSGLTKTGGSMKVTYNGTTTNLGYSGNSPLPFTGDNYHHEDDSWK